MHIQVRNPAARKGGLEISLFRRLSEAHPHAVVDLTSQYRMNEDIMLLSNKLIYGDRLRCGSEEVAKRTLVVPNECMSGTLDSGMCLCEESCWLRYLLSERSVHSMRCGKLIDLQHFPLAAKSYSSTQITCLRVIQELGISSKMMSRPSLCTRLQKRS